MATADLDMRVLRGDVSRAARWWFRTSGEGPDDHIPACSCCWDQFDDNWDENPPNFAAWADLYPPDAELSRGDLLQARWDEVAVDRYYRWLYSQSE